MRDHVARSIVGADIDVTVETGGKRFAVNGRDFRCKTEEEEAALPGHVAACTTSPW